MKFQLIIPMSGFGKRFQRVGYTTPKPLIRIFDKPMVEHVLSMFPGEKDVFFICNQEHLSNPTFSMHKILTQICPEGKIIEIAPHNKGPVYAISCAFEHFNPDAPTVVSYCDFMCLWNWEAFKQYVCNTRCDGAIVCYTGFHPHMLRSTKYAYVKNDGDTILSIQEKQSYTDNPMSEYASSGIYYFASGALMRRSFEKILDREQYQVNGEFFVSLAYLPMLEEKMDIRLFETKIFMQWGTPTDLNDFFYYARMHHSTNKKRERITHPGMLLLPMAGHGSRFSKEGYQIPKALIPVVGKPMFLQAKESLPKTQQDIFILYANTPKIETIKEYIIETHPNAYIQILSKPTDGQARTCMESKEKFISDLPLTIAACDNGYLYDEKIFNSIFENIDVDFIVWTVRGHPGAIQHPEMYGWVDADEYGWIKKVYVKKAFKNPEKDPIVTGTFTFRRSEDFIKSAQKMFERKGYINNEYYIDECCNDALALGLKGHIFDVESYLCWGTPNDLRTYEYWSNVFSQWPLLASQYYE